MTQPVSRDSAFPSPLPPLGPPPPPSPPEPALTPGPLGVDVWPEVQVGAPPVSLRLTPRIAGDPGGPAASAVGPRLDSFLDSASPTFQTNEGSVTAPIGFHMAGGQVVAPFKAELDQALAKLGIRSHDRDLLVAGKGTPQLVARVTQELIDEGHLPAITTKGDTSLVSRVRELMFQHGLGLDCAAYVIGAVSSVRGASSSAAAGFTIENDGLYTLGAKGYQRVPAGAPLQPGDIVCLHGKSGSPSDEHRAVVRDCEPLSSGDLQSAGLLPPKLVAAHSGDSWESIQVDSSWGNYGDPQEGGVARVTWWHDRTTDTWVSTQKGTVLTGNVPYGHDRYEVFRPTGAQ